MIIAIGEKCTPGKGEYENKQMKRRKKIVSQYSQINM